MTSPNIDEHPLFKHCLDKNYDLTSISMKEFNVFLSLLKNIYNDLKEFLI